MVIFGKTGKRIEMFSTKPDEKEILFDKGTLFKVKDIFQVTIKGQPITKIILEEM